MGGLAISRFKLLTAALLKSVSERRKIIMIIFGSGNGNGSGSIWSAKWPTSCQNWQGLNGHDNSNNNYCDYKLLTSRFFILFQLFFGYFLARLCSSNLCFASCMWALWAFELRIRRVVFNKITISWTSLPYKAEKLRSIMIRNCND